MESCVSARDVLGGNRGESAGIEERGGRRLRKDKVVVIRVREQWCDGELEDVDGVLLDIE